MSQQPRNQQGYGPPYQGQQPQGYPAPAQAPPPGYQYPPPGYPPGYQATPPRKRRRIFMWVFLAVQAVFLAWLITGLASASGSPGAAHDVAQQCAHGNWHGLFASYADCARHVRKLDTAAGDIGTGIGAALIIGLWVAVDFILGVSYLIYRLATRDRRAPYQVTTYPAYPAGYSPGYSPQPPPFPAQGSQQPPFIQGDQH